MNSLIYKQESYNIIGVCMEVHKELGKGFSENVYGDALEIELINAGVNYKREVKFNISYKENLLPHFYVADFIIENKIVLEIKAIEILNNSHVKQTLNYLAASKN
ncbi:GxxExxY protein [Polaribacter gangjinensis]|uniref:GxxExxY protein n=1 Tax=Polaribacter gangjinensis TaxID=574710 RepID=UPI0026C2CED9|nr:GxxExxY protein [Polaribacter gangjinensis]